MAEIKPSISRKLKKYIAEISEVCRVDRVVLFGSYAKGTYDKDSDIDLAVFSKDINDANRHEYMALFLKHVFKYKLDIQPMAFSLKDYHSKSNGLIMDEIRKNGVDIHA